MLTADLIFKLIRPTFGSILMSRKYKSWENSDYKDNEALVYKHGKEKGTRKHRYKTNFLYKNVQVDFFGISFSFFI